MFEINESQIKHKLYTHLNLKNTARYQTNIDKTEDASN